MDWWGCFSIWKKVFAWVQWQSAKVGRLVGMRPIAVLVGCAAFVMICCLGFIRASFVQQLDELWVPTNSQTVKDQHSFDRTFPTNPFSRLERFIVVPKNSSRDILDPALLSQVFDLFFTIINLSVEGGRARSSASTANSPGISSFPPPSPLGQAGIAEMCAQPVRGGGCMFYSPLGYWNHNASFMLSRTIPQLHQDANSLLLSGNMPVQQRQVLGCMTKVPSKVLKGDEDVVSVGALIFSFFMDTSRESLKTLEKWEGEFLKLLEDSQYNDIVAYGSSGVSNSQEISRQSKGDVLLLGVSYAVMCIYMVLALSPSPFALPSSSSPKPSFLMRLKMRALLGVGAVFVVSAAIIASLAFSAFFFRFNPLTVQILPFLMLSIGMDSVFILFTHFHKSLAALPPYQSPSHADLADALEDAMFRQGGSVGLTGLTKAISFLGPVLVLRIPALQQFCVVVAIAVVFELALALLAFNAMLILDARREVAARSDILPCVKPPHSSTSSSFPSSSPFASSHPTQLEPNLSPIPFKLCFSYSSSDTTVEDITEDREMPSESQDDVGQGGEGEGRGGRGVGGGGNKGGEEGRRSERPSLSRERGEVEKRGGFLDMEKVEEQERKTWLGRFLCDIYVPRVLAKPFWQVLIMAMFGALLGVGIYGCVTVDESLDLRSLVTEGTQLYYYLGLEETCNTRIGAPMFLVTEDVDYTSLTAQKKVLELTSRVENSSFVEPPVYSWINDFTSNYLPYSRWADSLDMNGQLASKEMFYEALNDFVSTSIEGFPYANDIIFQTSAANTTIGIKASRMRTFYRPLSTTKDFIHAILDVRRRVKESAPMKAYSTSFFYIFYEQFLDIVHQYALMLLLTIIAIFLTTLLFMGLKTAAVVSILVLVIHIDMLGLAAKWEVNLNAVSAVNAVAIMGLADEYVNYIMRGFELKSGTAQERLKWSLVQYVRPVSNAAISTLIGIIPLVFAKSAAYKVYYFRMFLLATLLSWLIGILFLPTILLILHGEGLFSPLCGIDKSTRPIEGGQIAEKEIESNAE